MTAQMTPRERVITALAHQEPDQVPIALGGGPYGLVDDLYFKMLDLLQLGDPVPPFRTGHNISYMDDRLLEKLQIDTRYVWPGLSPSSPVPSPDNPDKIVDGFGQPWVRAVPYYYADRGILVDSTDINDIDSLVKWPDTSDPKWTKGVRERAQALREGTDYFVIARMVTSYGPFQMACSLRGTEQFMIDMTENPDYAMHLLERITDTIVGLLRRYLEAGGAYFDMIELPGDDYAGNTNLVMSPRMFRRFIRPQLERIVGTIKTFNPNIKVMLHSDGAIEKLLPDLIEIGVDVVHPLEPLPAMDLDAIKEKYGSQISFLGGIDISHAMPGTKDMVIEEVKTRIRQLAPGGGYILAPANHLQADVPPENVVTLYETARQVGRYPIQIG